MKTKLFYSVIALLALVAFGCEKNEDLPNSKGKIEVYLLESFSKVGNSYQINESSVITQSSPLIYYSDILSYDSSEFTYQLSDRAKKAIEKLNLPLHGLAFAVMANGTLVYTGYFWPSYSSASCDWVVIDPIMTSFRKAMEVSLGYPGLLQGQIIPDKRNDARLINILKLDNKLK